MKKRSFTAGILATLGGVAVIYGTAGALNFKIDRPAWYSELIEVAGLSLPDVLEKKETQVIQIRATIKELQDGGKQPAPWLIQQLKKLKRDIRNIDKILDDK